MEVFLLHLGTGTAISLGNVVAASDGTWTLDYTGTMLSDGAYEITATASDGTTTSDPSPAFSLVVDTSIAAPSVTGISDDTGVLDNDGITEDNTLFLHGTAEANSTVSVFIDDVKIGEVEADGAGNWTLDHTAVPLPAGTHYVSAQATDIAGNTSVISGSYQVVVNTPPADPTPIAGTEGDDRIVDTAGNDVIDARGGNDIIYVSGGANTNVVDGGSGTDVIIMSGLMADYTTEPVVNDQFQAAVAYVNTLTGKRHELYNVELVDFGGTLDISAQSAIGPMAETGALTLDPWFDDIYDPLGATPGVASVEAVNADLDGDGVYEATGFLDAPLTSPGTVALSSDTEPSARLRSMRTAP